jgi:uncharacterized protein YbcV (DUF1398 family)
MNNAQEKLQAAIQYAMTHRPKVGGFPFLAECLRRAGVERNIWALPGSQSVYVMKGVVLVQQGIPLVSGMAEVSAFDTQGLIAALRTDQAGQSTFPEFLRASWKAGVVGYEVNFSKRTVAYFGARGEEYVESYPEVEVLGLNLSDNND